MASGASARAIAVSGAQGALGGRRGRCFPTSGQKWAPLKRGGVGRDGEGSARPTHPLLVPFPLLVRMNFAAQVGGLDEGMSDAGQCGIFGDWVSGSRTPTP